MCQLLFLSFEQVSQENAYFFLTPLFISQCSLRKFDPLYRGKMKFQICYTNMNEWLEFFLFSLELEHSTWIREKIAFIHLFIGVELNWWKWFLKVCFIDERIIQIWTSLLFDQENIHSVAYSALKVLHCNFTQPLDSKKKKLLLLKRLFYWYCLVSCQAEKFHWVSISTENFHILSFFREKWRKREDW